MAYTPPSIEQGRPFDEGNILRRFKSLEEFASNIEGGSSGGGIATGSSPPTSPSPDEVWLDTTEYAFKFWDDAEQTWVPVAPGGTFPPELGAGRELAYAETNLQNSTAGGAVAVTITGLLIEFEVTDRPVMVELFLPWVTCTATATVVGGIIDGNFTNLAYGAAYVASSHYVSLIARERIVTPGVYSRVGTVQRSAGSGTVTNNANLPSIISTLRAVQV